MNIVILKNLISEFGLYGSFKVCLWRIVYRFGCRRKTTKKIYIKSIGHVIFFRPYTTDILLLLNFFGRPLNDGGMEYKIDFSGLLDRVNNVIDAGANIGLFTMLYKRLYPNAKFICIEPDMDNFKILKKNMENYSDVECIWGDCPKTRLREIFFNRG